ncbi:MAG: TraB/GumN family protein [Verrucomicrobia bacterium]|nr:TraB/GumN family protein [Verrucomicrobiota bacterium]MDA1087464.1 TraB/GumN family protein [Verrucomicrobiota bacterium]
MACLLAGALLPGLASAEVAVATKPFMWKASAGSATVYMLGSMHIARTNLYPLAASIEAAFASSESVVFEVPMDPKSQFEALKKMTAAAVLPEDETLADHLPKDVLKTLDAYLAEAGMDVGTLYRLRPWYVAIAITLQAAQEAGFNPMWGIDAHFLRKLGTRATSGLETIDEQVGMLAGLTAEQQRSFLETTLKDAGQAGAQIAAIADIWSMGDADALDVLLRESLEGNEEFQDIYDAMITDRNYRMADKIEALLETESTYFVIVGASHLVGAEGILEILRKKNHEVVQQ